MGDRDGQLRDRRGPFRTAYSVVPGVDKLVPVDVLGFILALWGLTFRGVNSGWYPVFIAVAFTALAITGIYYALSGEKRWVV